MASQNMRCYECGQFGHMQKNCTRPKTCWTCGKTGHLQAKCWQGQDQAMSLNQYDDDAGLTLLEVCKTAGSKSLMSASAEEKVEEVNFIVDSGAAETVIPRSTAGHVAAMKGLKFGTQYKGIDGSKVENQGEKTLRGSVGRNAVSITAQVCNVTKPLYSVAQAVMAGHDVTFTREGGGMTHRRTGRWFQFTLRNGMYELIMQLSPGFTRLGASA